MTQHYFGRQKGYQRIKFTDQKVSTSNKLFANDQQFIHQLTTQYTKIDTRMKHPKLMGNEQVSSMVRHWSIENQNRYSSAVNSFHPNCYQSIFAPLMLKTEQLE